MLLVSVVAGVLAVALVLAGVMWLSGSDEAGQPQAANEPVEVDPTSLENLPVADTHATIEGAPEDPDPQGETDGTIVHPTVTTPVHDAPDGEPIARMEPEQLGDTWLTVIDEQDGWVQVLMPSRPNLSTGWLPTDDLEEAYTPYVIEVHLGSMEMNLRFEGEQVESWEIGIGKEDTPTPTGRTYLMGSFTDANQPFSEVILPLGSHSDTLDDFGGGPGTVAIHTWPTEDVLGTATSHGCIRVPQHALERLTEVPLGTPVLVDQQ
ncbi:L,D-transpeptidase [Haloechinothrix sp. YIM 98757]|uniref:L,D-transpeptidase n=1 Tax=Haloechinothrix aidingensis TaxID=2752311 RepID=A0A837ZZU1_9PSEU|nr:L,D-transpeptidase [Haloechinothrix aidingensis]MBA0125774.1 L,D-transpeptidase [Haloechinothrix aidingensis]